MTRYLLDTNHISPLVTLEHPLRQTILQRLTNDDQFFTCVPTLTEMLYGISVLPRAKKNLAEWERLRPNFSCYMLDEQDAEQASKFRVLLRRQGWQLATIDSLIAAIAIRYNLVLLTTDGDFRAIPQLTKENWLAT
jgi:tRNA(fMet)-specific endonuclease VapC